MPFVCPACKAESHHPMDIDYGYCPRCKKFADDMVAATARTVVGINANAHQRNVLNVWTIFDHPRDYPDGYIARCFETGAGMTEPVPTNYTITGDLPLIRATLDYAGLVRMMRSEGDDKNIVESWL